MAAYTSTTKHPPGEDEGNPFTLADDMENADVTFADFWAAWPRHPRKGQRRLCGEKWAQKGLDSEADNIVAHVAWLRTTDAWIKDSGAYIPAPLVYLNQERWDGAELPESAEQSKARLAAHEARTIRESIERAGMAQKPTVRRIA